MDTSGITKELLGNMGFPDAEVLESERDGRVRISVTIGNARELIGEGGETLALFQHIVRRIAARRVSPTPLLDVDINGYKRIREDILRDFALSVGKRVRTEKKSVELKPMPSYDRRVIHLALANSADLTTESMGEGDGRYIVVRPYP
jgi:spoIIIJ-associated protein